MISKFLAQMGKQRWCGGSVNCLDQKNCYVKNLSLEIQNSPQFWDRDLTSSYVSTILDTTGG